MPLGQLGRSPILQRRNLRSPHLQVKNENAQVTRPQGIAPPRPETSSHSPVGRNQHRKIAEPSEPYDSSYIPVAYPSESEHPLEAKSGTESRFSSLYRSRSSTSLKSRAKRQSHVTGVPFLEVQLLPSLRDTIDKMTRPPTKTSTSSESSYMAVTDHEVTDSAIISTPSYVETTSSDGNVPERPGAKLKPGKSTFKSSLKSPVPKYNHSIATSTDTPSSPNSGTSLRSVRAILGRTPSMTPDGRSYPISGTKIPSRIPLHHRPQRPRSSTDPGRVTHTSKATTEASVRTPTVQNPPSQTPKSNIPRFNHKPWTRPGIPTDDSDLDYQYQAWGQMHRRLVVANAEVVSSSGSENEPPATPKPTFTTPSISQKISRRSVGEGPLGLGLRLPSEPTAPQRTQPGQRMSYTNNALKKDRSQIASILQSRLEDNGTDDFYEDEERQRRRADLLGLVTVLDSNLVVPSGAQRLEESDYYGEEGVAITFSGDSGPYGHEDDDFDEESDYGDEDTNPVTWSYPQESSIIGAKTTKMVPSAGNVDHRSTTSPHARSPVAGAPILERSTAPCSSLTVRSPAPSPRTSATSRSPNAGPPLTHRENQLNRSHVKGIADTPRRRDAPQERKWEHERGPNAIPHAAPSARERQVLGIPPSDSDQVATWNERRHNSALLSHAESYLSSLESVDWEEDARLSAGAQSLFRKLSDGEPPEGRMQNRFSSTQQRNNFDGTTKGQRRSITQTRSPKAVSFNDQASEEPKLPRDSGLANHITPNPRTRRQTIITEICESEKTFADRLRIFVELFVLPLRVQNSKTWISGVPDAVARLLDWLEDISNLHQQVFAALQNLANAQRPIISIASVLHPFVSRLEIYQPYIVRLAEVSDLIEGLANDDSSDFGEFIRLQEESPSAEGWTIERFLVEPVGRLTTYQQLFEQLMAVTPRTHSDYISTFSLFHSTDLMIKVLTEVKLREDEYQMLKQVSTRIYGLSQNAPLAGRERRVLLDGPVRLLHPTRSQSIAGSSGSFSVLQSTLNSRARVSNRSSRLVDAIGKWNVRRDRSGSVASSSTGVSFRSFGTNTSGSSVFPPSSTCFSSSSTRFRSVPCREKSSLELGDGPLELQAFVFSDLLLLARLDHLGSTDQGRGESWTILDKFGVSKIFGATEVLEDMNAIEIEIIPIELGNLNQPASFDKATLQTLRLDISSPDLVDAPDKFTWLSAFRQSSQATLRSLSVPSRLATDLAAAPHQDQSRLSLLGPGMPLPKSPSAQLNDERGGHDVDMATREREERGWWSVRFQQVFRELQYDVSLS